MTLLRLTSRLLCIACAFLVRVSSAQLPVASAGLDFLNHNQPILDAHNCYPYEGRWNDRVSRALHSGFPVSIEQDLAWYVDPATGKGRVVVSHTPTPTGAEPTLRASFFDQARPMVEKALAENRRETWPVLILHFDFKDNRPELLEAVWQLLGDYEPWISTATKTSDPAALQPIERRPVLVVTEDSDQQQAVFFDKLAVGAKLRLFGSAHGVTPPNLPKPELMHWAASVSPDTLLSEKPTNYRRWWNSSWYAVEEGGQSRAGEWTPADDHRLRSLVDHAHALGFWIRFYTLDGFTPAEDQGWGEYYNFGSRAAVEARWKATVAADVNFIATDQYEALAPLLQQDARDLRPSNPHTTDSSLPTTRP